MSTDFVSRFSSLFTAATMRPTQPWTSKIDVDAMIEAMAANRKGPKVSRSNVLLIKKLLASINFTPDHPVYPVMIEEAIASLNDGKGCNKDEISEFIASKYKVSPVVHLARLVVELDKCVRDEMIVFTSDKLYMARAVSTDGNSGSNGGAPKQFRRGQKMRAGGSSSGSEMRKIGDNVVEDHQIVGRNKQSETRIEEAERVVTGEEGLEGGNVAMNEDGPLAPGFEGCLVPNDGRGKQVGFGDVVSVDSVEEGRDQCVDGDGGSVNLQGQSVEVMEGQAKHADEEERQPVERALVIVHDPLEADDIIQPTPLCSLPSEGKEGDHPAQNDLVLNVKEDAALKNLKLVVLHDPLEAEDIVQATPLCSIPGENKEGGDTAEVDPGLKMKEDAALKKLYKRTHEIKSWTRPPEEEEEKMILQEKHDEVVSMIGDLSAIVAKHREERLQYGEVGNKKQWFKEASEEQYKEIFQQTEAIQLALKEVMAKAREVNMPNHVASEAESSKGMMQNKPSRKTKRVKWSPELDITPLANSCPDKIQVRQGSVPTILKFRIAPQSPHPQKHVLLMDKPCRSTRRQKLICGLENQMQAECPKRELVCGLKKVEEDRSRKQSSSQLDQVRCIVAKDLNRRATECLKYDMNWKVKRLRCKRPRIKGPNVKEFSTLARKCIQMGMQLQMKDSSQPDEGMHRGMSQLSPSQHGNQLQDNRNALPVELDEEQGSQIQALQVHPTYQIDEDLRAELACVDRQDDDVQQSVESTHDGRIPQLNQNSEAATVASSVHFEHLSNEQQGNQQQVQDQEFNHPEENLHQQEGCSHHQCEGEAETLLEGSDHTEEQQHHHQSQEQASSEQNHPRQVESRRYSQQQEQKSPVELQTSDLQEQQQHVEDQAFYQPVEELKLQSEDIKAEGRKQQDQHQCEGGEAHSLLEEKQQSEAPVELQTSDLQEQQQHVEDQAFYQPVEELKLQSEDIKAEGYNQQDQHQCQGGEAHNLLEEKQQSEAQVSSQQNYQQQVESPAQGYSELDKPQPVQLQASHRQEQHQQQMEEDQALNQHLKLQNESPNQQELPQHVEAEGEVQNQQQHVEGEESSKQEELEVETEENPSVESAKSVTVAVTPPSVQKKQQQSKLVSGEARLTRARATAVAEALSPPSLSTRNSKKQKTQR
ncbi:hypothetical protein LINPERHAP1_LOCUS42460 [Linum perenne]